MQKVPISQQTEQKGGEASCQNILIGLAAAKYRHQTNMSCLKINYFNSIQKGRSFQ